ncbi:PrpF domain-containing protein [Erwinia amylovora]|uniref:Methylitaconate Delta-isomerase n=4 Tax=Erwinia amylovora TaxID=552 RepID=A0A831ET40_ERWAM|nr:PrpF domain-containing protein [Erwinia amylovora]CBX80351.1 Uncharacterized protein ybhH [Erwinia amylovora ATCC BAA-2158]CDK14997.1 putative protein ybhH [Erwinia amylovora LA635]CDK18365.1 putative protein ybhH [Erwinia amylovora LA636]CDK21734.1 putative protein ybhH [Erwinia amylovora LA637]ATZ11319.1 hypothetical protein AD997_07540 [Erwinia amylovora]
MEKMKKIPLYYVRGGTSSGVVILKENLPEEKEEINKVMRRIFGAPRMESQKPDPFQTEGIGKGKSTSNKAFIIDIDKEQKVVTSTFLQLESTSPTISWRVNCGNMTSSIPLVLEDMGIVDQLVVNGTIHIRNTNTRKDIYCKIYRQNGGLDTCRLPGIENEYPKVDMSFKDPAGAVTGSLFPTGKKTDVIDDVAVTCIDAVMPMVIIHADSLGINGDEGKQKLAAMDHLLERVNSIRIKAGIMMRLKNSDGSLMTESDIANSITLPKVAIISQGNENCDISMIYLTPKEIHQSIAVSGGCCLACACGIEGTVAAKQYSAKNQVRIKHFAGISIFGFSGSGEELEVYTQRNAQIYMKGDFFIY